MNDKYKLLQEFKNKEYNREFVTNPIFRAVYNSINRLDTINEIHIVRILHVLCQSNRSVEEQLIKHYEKYGNLLEEYKIDKKYEEEY